MVLLSKVQVVALHGSDDRQSVSEVLRRVESVVTGMAEYIETQIAANVAVAVLGLDSPQEAALLRYMDKVQTLEIVRCRDCLYHGNHMTGCSKLHGLETPYTFFCAYGRRKRDGE